MSQFIVNTSSPILIVGGADIDKSAISDGLAFSDKIVAADGGAAAVLWARLRPDAVIGDFDSLDHGLLGAIPPDALHRISEQDSTDFAKVLRTCHAPLFIGVGFLGTRLDHTLAVLSTLATMPQVRCVLIGDHDVVTLCPPRLHLPLTSGTRVSLWPLAPIQGSSTGLRWPIDGLTLSPDGRVGTSNKAEGPVDLTFDGPGMALLLPRSELALLVAAMLAAPGTWPARGR